MLRRHTDTVAARSASATTRALVLAGVLVLIGLGMAVPMRSWLSQQAEIASLRSEVEQARAEVAGLEVQRERWKDPAYIAAQARKRLLFVFPGEIGYVAIGTTAPEQEPLPVDQRVDMSWYERLWLGLKDADAPMAVDQGTEQLASPQGPP
jgi:cell division protein FtsB